MTPLTERDDIRDHRDRDDSSDPMDRKEPADRTDAAEPTDPKIAARIDRVLTQTPLIDGHNDLPWEIRTRFASKLEGVDLKANTSKLASPEEGGGGLMTDIPRLRAGRMGGKVEHQLLHHAKGSPMPYSAAASSA